MNLSLTLIVLLSLSAVFAVAAPVRVARALYERLDEEEDGGGFLTNLLYFPEWLYKQLPLSEEARETAHQAYLSTINFPVVGWLLSARDGLRDTAKAADKWISPDPATTTTTTTSTTTTSSTPSTDDWSLAERTEAMDAELEAWREKKRLAENSTTNYVPPNQDDILISELNEAEAELEELKDLAEERLSQGRNVSAFTSERLATLAQTVEEVRYVIERRKTLKKRYELAFNSTTSMNGTLVEQMNEALAELHEYNGLAEQQQQQGRNVSDLTSESTVAETVEAALTKMLAEMEEEEEKVIEIV